MPTLTDIADEYIDLLDAMADADGCDDEYLQSVAGMISDAGGRLAEKAEGYASVIRELELRAEAQRDEADRLLRRAKTAEANASWLKSNLLRVMTVTNTPKLAGDRFTLRVARNSTRPLRLLCETESIPDEFVRVTREPDRRAITDALKAGTELPFAVLDEAGQHLRIS